MATVTVAVLATFDSKGDEARYLSSQLAAAGVTPWCVDLSLRAHDDVGGDVSGGDLAARIGSTWEDLGAVDRAKASDQMTLAARGLVREKFEAGEIDGVIGIGGANGTSMACTIMRGLPHLFPKAMVSAVAATGAVQWYVAESDIAMFPSVGDLNLNRITRGVLNNAARAVAAMAAGRDQNAAPADRRPLIGVSAFGGTQKCVDVVTEKLTAAGFEIIHFHASGPGGRALEALAAAGELAGVVDVTTSELTDLVVDGVYSAGEDRLTAASAAGLPQVICPGALDHANFWVGQAPAAFRDREFLQYNAQNLLMRTNGDEYRRLGHLFAERLNTSSGPVMVLIPQRGYSEHTKRKTYNLDGTERGDWLQADTDAIFAATVKSELKSGEVRELDLHINDTEFGEACVSAFLEMMR